MGKLQFSEPLYCTHSSLSYFAYKKQFPPLLIYKEKTTNTLNSKKKSLQSSIQLAFIGSWVISHYTCANLEWGQGEGGMFPIAKFKQLIMKIHVVLDPLRIHFIPTLPNYSRSAHAVPMVKGPKTKKGPNFVSVFLCLHLVHSCRNIQTRLK